MNRFARKLSLLALLLLTLAFVPGTRPAVARPDTCCSACADAYDQCCQSTPDQCQTTCDDALARCARWCNTGC